MNIRAPSCKNLKMVPFNIVSSWGTMIRNGWCLTALRECFNNFHFFCPVINVLFYLCKKSSQLKDSQNHSGQTTGAPSSWWEELLWSICMWGHHILKSKTKERLKVISPSRIRCTNHSSVYNFPRPSFGKQCFLNFWRLHAKLYDFVRNISTNISTLGQHTHLEL